MSPVRVRVGFFLAVFAATSAFVAVVAACGDEAAAPRPKLGVTLVVEGEGTVRSEPAGHECAGPRDCGAVSYDSDTVVFRATPGSGYVLAAWELDGARADPAETLRVTDAARGSHRALARFVPSAAGGTTPDGGIEAGAGPDGGAATVCGASTCTGDRVCCVGLGSVACRPPGSCPNDVARCTTNAECGAGGVCCFTGFSGSGASAKLACEAAEACAVPVCATDPECTAAGTRCAAVAQTSPVKVCLPPP